MNPLQSEPPKLDFPLPKQWKKWLEALRTFVTESQPLPGIGLKCNATKKGRLFKVDIDEVVAAVDTRRLMLVNASTNGSPKVRVTLGWVAGRKADSSMDDPGDDPVFTITLPSAVATKYILCQVTVAYSAATGIWSSSASECIHSASITANDATNIYVTIGSVNVVSNGAGGYTVQVNHPQPVDGDQWVARTGNASTYVDANGH